MLGDGIRRNIATVSKEERDRLRDAFLALQKKLYPGTKGDPIPGAVSYWFKQDEIHDSTHVHFCPAFLPWHRELVARMEADLREIDPALSLHYWDWTQDPTNAPDGQGGFVNLFTPAFMGNAIGPGSTEVEIGDPFKTAGFYGGPGPFRDNTGNPADPPQTVTRQVGVNANLVNPADEQTLLNAPDFVAFDNQMEGLGLNLHAQGHSYIGGTMLDPHTSFRDPFAFLLHSNVDRLFAMWQRKPGHPERLDPAQLYKAQSTNQNGFENTKGGDRTTIDPPGAPQFGDDDVSSLRPWWGILSPLEPWAGPGNTAQTAATGIIKNVKSTRPWAPPENQQLLKDSRHPTVVFPPSYDTVPHSAYFIRDLDTFSNSQVQADPAFPAAMTLIYDGFTLNELGGNPPAPPAFQISFDNQGGPDASAFVSVAAEAALLEDPNAGPDIPQRISFPIDIQFVDQTVFNSFVDTRFVFIRATHGITVTDTGFELTKQPNPYMRDGAISWLSTDVRVFKLTPSGKLQNSNVVLTDPNAPLTYLTSLLAELRNPNGSGEQIFDAITPDEQASELEPSQTEGTTPVFNYALAKVRYRANTVAANGVQVFFRTFSTLRSALDYSYVGNNPPTINYPRSGIWPSAVPLLGLIDGEIASIPYFAVDRVDSTVQPMTAQLLDTPNIQTINAAGGQEAVMFFGCWLDFNQPTPRFPFNPVGIGPFTNPQSIPAVINGLHVCLVAEIFFQPGGGADPIPSGSTPASSDRLAQRNLAFVGSGNPGGGATHTAQHSFMLKPSPVPVDFKPDARAAAVAERFGLDELMIRWNDLPRATKATLYVPEWDADEVLRLAAARQHPEVLHKVDAHTVQIDIADLGFVPIPGFILNSYAGLLTLELPQGVRAGQVFNVDFHQYSRIRARFNGAFRLTIPVQTDEALLPAEIRHLAFLRYVAQARPATNRWQLIFGRWLSGLAAKVRGLGGDPDQVPPSLTDPGIHGPPKQHEVSITGKVSRIFYDCFGDFKGFDLADCDCVHHFDSSEPPIEEIVRRACRERTVLTVEFEPVRRRIHGFVIECARCSR